MSAERDGLARTMPNAHRLLANWGCKHLIAYSTPLPELVWGTPGMQVRACPDTERRFDLIFTQSGELRLDFEAERIEVRGHEGTSAETLDHLVADQAGPRILAHLGELVVHASGVVTERGVAMFAGPSGTGKSTLAASFMAAGFGLVGDDALVIENRPGEIGVAAVYRSLRLFPDSLAETIGTDVAVAPVCDDSEKLNVVTEGDGGDGPVKVAGFFLLETADSESIEAERLRPWEACLQLVEHSFWLDPSDLDRIRGKMRKASAFATAIPCWRLRIPRDFSRLADVRQHILECLEAG